MDGWMDGWMDGLSVFCLYVQDPRETSGTPSVLLKHKHTHGNSCSVPQGSHRISRTNAFISAGLAADCTV